MGILRTIDKVQQWAIGPGLIVLAQYAQLAPKFVVSNALLVDGHAEEELILRSAMAKAMLVCLVCEMVWTASRPQGVSLGMAGIFLIISTLISGITTALAYMESDKFGPQTAFGLQVASGIFTIPVSQCTALWRLGQIHSPVRWRVVGWIVTIMISTLSLLVPFLATMTPTLVLGCAFPFSIALCMWCVDERHVPSDPSVDDKQGKSASNSNNNKSVRGPRKKSPTYVPIWPTTLHFLLLAVVCGTNAEAINDMATGLCIRASQAKGNFGLALTNNISILLSQLLALASETGWTMAVSNETSRVIGFLGLWSCTQILRGFGMTMLDDGGATGSSALAFFVFIDKYTGSLGQSAIETASVALLQANDAQSVESTLQRQKLAKRFSKHERRESRNIGPSVPAAFLLSLRGASQKFERPLWEMVLLQQTSLPLPMEWVVVTFILVGGSLTVHALLSYMPKTGQDSTPKEHELVSR